MVVREGKVYFSDGCPQALAYNGLPLSPANLLFTVDYVNSDPKNPDAGPRDVEATAYFAQGEGETRKLSAGVNGVYPVTSEAADVLIKTAIVDDGPMRVGRELCSKIATCPGPLVQQGESYCPAMNEETILEAATKVANEG